MTAGDRGRTGAGAPRGSARRAALVRAVAELVADGGPSAVSARAAARRAGVPLAAVTYYFDDVPALVREGVELLLDGLGTEVRERSAAVLPPLEEDRDGSRVAAAVVALVLGPYGARGAAGVRALHARTLELSGDGALAPQLRTFDAACAEGVARLLRAAGRTPVAARGVLALVDGWLVAAAVAGDGPGPAGADRLQQEVAERLAPGLLALAPARGAVVTADDAAEPGAAGS